MNEGWINRLELETACHRIQSQRSVAYFHQVIRLYSTYARKSTKSQIHRIKYRSRIQSFTEGRISSINVDTERSELWHEIILCRISNTTYIYYNRCSIVVSSWQINKPLNTTIDMQTLSLCSDYEIGFHYVHYWLCIIWELRPKSYCLTTMKRIQYLQHIVHGATRIM